MSETERVGTRFNRPECVVTTRRGDIYASYLPGGVSVVRASGKEETLAARNAPEGFVTNGFCLESDGTFLLANMGEGGGVWRLERDLSLNLLFNSVDGVPMTHTNYVGPDKPGRYWITVTTQQPVMVDCLNAKSRDGFIIVLDERGPRIVADGMCVTNEAKVDPTGQWLYVNETFGRCLSRFPIRQDSSLGEREIVAQFADGSLPDGLAHDADGGVWVANLVSNRIVRVDAESGQVQTILEDRNQPIIDELERLISTGKTLTRLEIDTGRFSTLGSAPSVTFGGEDLRTVYVGSLNPGHVTRFRTEYTGAKPVHWDY